MTTKNFKRVETRLVTVLTGKCYLTLEQIYSLYQSAFNAISMSRIQQGLSNLTAKGLINQCIDGNTVLYILVGNGKNADCR